MKNGLGTVSKPEKFLNQDFNQLKQYCLIKNIRYIDDMFPPDRRSIGKDVLNPDDMRRVEWLRPHVSVFMAGNSICDLKLKWPLILKPVNSSDKKFPLLLNAPRDLLVVDWCDIWLLLLLLLPSLEAKLSVLTEANECKQHYCWYYTSTTTKNNNDNARNDNYDNNNKKNTSSVPETCS